MEDFDREDDNAGNTNNTNNNNNPNQELDEFQDLLHIGQGIKKRLLIKSILFENFKSYAGQVSMGPFHKRFTAVVGPNGNGKSNLIDGLLFVFGFRADKLRLKKASELIHKSAENPNAPFARVTVNFCEIEDEDDDVELDSCNSNVVNEENAAPNSLEKAAYKIIPGSEFTLSRKVTHDNHTTFKLNDKTVKFKTVMEILIRKGIDLNHNRFLILQGEVEKISLMKPMELLDYLEEILGTKAYIPQLQMLEKQVDDALVIVDQKTEIHEASKKDKDAIEPAMLSAVRFMRTMQDLSASKQEIASRNIQRIENKVSETEEKMNHLKVKIEEENNASSARTDMLNTLTEEISKLKADAKALETKKKDLTDKRNKRERELAKANQELESLNDKFNTSSEKLKNLKSEISDLEKSKIQLRVNLPNYESASETCEIEAQSIDAKLRLLKDRFQENTQQKTEEIEQCRKELSKAKDKASKESMHLMNEKNEISTIEKRVEDAKKRLSSLEKQKEELDNSKQMIDEMDKKIQFLLSEIEKEKAALGKVEKEEKTLQTERDSLFESLSKHREVSSKSRSDLVSKLRSAKKNILGRLGNLGQIDAKYDVAISTIASGSMDHIVCKATEDAQDCIEYLRTNNLGRANFTVMDVLDRNNELERAMNAQLKLPEKCQRLFDLIQCKPEYKRAFYRAVRDSLVIDSEDIEEAHKASRDACGQSIGFRWRVITLKGELIEPSGTISGGGKQYQRGAMALIEGSIGNSKSSSSTASNNTTSNRKSRSDAEDFYLLSDEQVTEQENRIKAIDALIDNLIAKRDLESNEIRKLSADLQETQDKMKKMIARSSKTSSDDREQLIKRIEKYRQDSVYSAEEQARLDELNDVIPGLEEASRKAQEEAKNIAKKLSNLENELKNIGAAEFSTLEKELKAAKSRCDQARSKLDNCAADLKTTEEKLQESQIAIEKIEKEFETNKAQIQRYQEDVLSCETSINEYKTQLEELVISIKEIENTISSRKKAMEDVQKDLESQMGRLKEMQDQLVKFQKEKSQSLEAKAGWAASFKTNQAIFENHQLEDESILAAVEDEESRSLSRTAAEIRSEISARADEELEAKIQVNETEVNRMKGGINLSAIDEYREKLVVFNSTAEVLCEAILNRNEKQQRFEDLKKRRLDQFMTGFLKITLHLKEMYQMITLGGDADLELDDEMDPFSQGVSFSVRPPRKAWNNISNLSGGEKTLSSLALVFALHHFCPSPLYIMDEIDAALDFKNVSIVANYIAERTKNAQFIIISLRNNMFEVADRLVGIYKTHNASKNVTIDPTLGGAMVPLSAP